jgi:hypothetical protein
MLSANANGERKNWHKLQLKNLLKLHYLRRGRGRRGGDGEEQGNSFQHKNFIFITHEYRGVIHTEAPLS